MKPSEKQSKILDWAMSNTEITKRKAVELIGGDYYHNADKHVGDVLSRMVNSGLLKRIKNGVYALGDGIRKTDTEPVPENQLKLF